MSIEDNNISENSSNIDSAIDKPFKKKSLPSEDNITDVFGKRLSQKVESETELQHEKISIKIEGNSNLASTTDENQLSLNIPLPLSETLIPSDVSGILASPDVGKTITPPDTVITTENVDAVLKLNETCNDVIDLSDQLRLKTDDNLENESDVPKKRDKTLKSQPKPVDNEKLEEIKSQPTESKSLSISEEITVKKEEKVNLKVSQEKKIPTSSSDTNEQSSSIPSGTKILKPSESDIAMALKTESKSLSISEEITIKKEEKVNLKVSQKKEIPTSSSDKNEKSSSIPFETKILKPPENDIAMALKTESKSQTQESKLASTSEEVIVRKEETENLNVTQDEKILTSSSDKSEPPSSIPSETKISKTVEKDMALKTTQKTEIKNEISSDSQIIEKLEEDSNFLSSNKTTSSAETRKPDIPSKQRDKAKVKDANETPSSTISLSKSTPVEGDKNTEKDNSVEELSSSVNKLGLNETDIPNEKEKLTVQKANADEAPALPRKRRRDITSVEAKSSSSSTESLSSCESSTSKHGSTGGDNICEPSSIPDVPVRRRRSVISPSTSTPSRRKSSSDSSSSSSVSKSSVHSKSSTGPELTRKRLSIDERVAKLQNEGKCSNTETAFIAAKLIEMQFEEEDALLASKQCSSVYHAVKFLTQLCELCNCRFPINLMVSMVHCTHRACKECLKAHFTTLIYDRSIFSLLCPICHLPDITDQNIQEYFNHLDIMLRRILESHVYDLFQRKLRDEVLTKDPNFHWCSQCSSGFIASPRLKKLYCPDCSAITCASCHQTWELEHEGVHCERFQQWKDMHTPEPPPAGLVKYLTDRGITCPSCGLLYNQACGGCLIYKCSHCSFEFCGFCIQALKRAKDCSGKSCITSGAHIHHPLNCLFFIRDKEISDIQMLLEEESVEFLTIPPKDQIVKSRCQVREQKHIHGTISEDRCGRDIVPYCAGLCRTHYYEYLAELLRKNKISPLSIMTTQDLQFMLRKSRVPVPEKVKGETNEEYYSSLTKIVSSSLK